jgi:hypothetical protein
VTTRRLDPNIRRSRTRRTNILLREGFSKTEISRLKLDRRAMDDPFVKELRNERRGVPPIEESRRLARNAHRRLKYTIATGGSPFTADIHRAERSRARQNILRAQGLPFQMVEQYDLDMVQGNNKGLHYFMREWNKLKVRGLTHAEARAEINGRLRRVTSDSERSGLDLIYEVYNEATLRRRRRAIRRAA